MLDHLPPEVVAVLGEFRVCEFSTLAKDGTPITWPLAAHWDPAGGIFIVTTSIGLPQKAFNIRRSPQVSLLFSEATGSGLENPPAVLVQGTASAPDKIVVSTAGLEGYWRDAIFSRQPGSKAISHNPLMRMMMDWYYMRIVITVKPRMITWWPGGDFSQAAGKLEVVDVD